MILLLVVPIPFLGPDGYQALASGVQAAGVIITLGFIGIEMNQSRATSRARAQADLDEIARRDEERSRGRRQATLEFARSTLDYRYSNWEALPEDFDRGAVESMVNEFIAGREQRTLGRVLEYLGLLETLCTGIKLDIYDARTLYELYGGRVVATAQNYGLFIAWRRDLLGKKSLYVELESQAAEFERWTRLDA
ncbi:hypothetical protein FHX39_001297 [Friedmanniella antarctica]|uniref:DUF4760 domain-containing protein n=1 Tax=Microlunatus antarcticus TaxID=53388 RepID=A0A7W5JU62_9ACTN|nr:hypothetical protein [Microlunatus antarcticus]MBB3326353.1 hypothetical protein [Microlunatus antarcticus]